MFPVPAGLNIPIISPIAHNIEAKNIGIGRENAQTVIKGFFIVKAPIIPNMAPEAPNDE